MEMTDTERALSMFTAAIQDMRKGKVRLHPDMVPVIKTLIICKIREHQTVLDALKRKTGREKFEGIEKSILYRKNAVTALTDLANRIHVTVRRGDFWEDAERVAAEEGLVDHSAESIGLSVNDTDQP